MENFGVIDMVCYKEDEISQNTWVRFNTMLSELWFFFLPDYFWNKLKWLSWSKANLFNSSVLKKKGEKTQKLYFVIYHKCSDLLWEKIILEIEKKLLKFADEGQEFAKFLRSLEQFIQTVKGETKILVTEGFFNLFLEVSHIY